MRKKQEGMALVLTLMVLAIMTAMIVEFAYGVYVNTSFLHNWQTSERLSLSAKSGVSLASRFITQVVGKMDYTYPGAVDMPLGDLFGDGKGDLNVDMRIEDESSKFNINKIVYPGGDLNEKAYESFRRMLEYLALDEDIADIVADWIDRNEMPRVAGSETDAKNAPLDSTDELLVIPGISRAVYDKLIPYVTVYGSGLINMNGAEVPVLVSLSGYIEGDIDEDMAQRIIDRRELKPFKLKGEVFGVPGFKGLQAMPITLKGETFRVYSTASSGDGIKRIIECVLDLSGTVRYWKEI